MAKIKSTPVTLTVAANVFQKNQAPMRLKQEWLEFNSEDPKYPPVEFLMSFDGVLIAVIGDKTYEIPAQNLLNSILAAENPDVKVDAHVTVITGGIHVTELTQRGGEVDKNPR